MQLTRSLVYPLAIAALVSVAGCGTSATEPGQQSNALTALPRALSATEEGVRSASNDFSFGLWKQIVNEQPGTNVFVSPLSASFALGMALNGAANETFDQMRAGLQLGSEPLASIDSGYQSLIALLTGLDPSVTMQIANSIWYRNTFTVNQPFLDNGTHYFDATIKPLDFSDVSGSLGTINGWVNAQTKGRIPEILTTIDRDDMMFLINAIYFKGTWRKRFDSTLTETSAFHGAGGDQTARLMHRTGSMAYAETPTYQGVDLAYGDSAFSMTVLLPKSGTSVDALATSLDASSWQQLTSSFQSSSVDLYLPKLTMTWDDSLNASLEALGMQVPFTDAADFSRMTPAPVEISQVHQKTFVTIDEQGTEAAAVTSVGIGDVEAALPTMMRVDRPFIFVIRERLTGTVLFMGKVESIPAT